MQEFEARLREIVNEDQIKKKYALKKATYIQLGGDADYFIMPQTYEEVSEIKRLCNKHQVNLTVLGRGTNVIIKDKGIRGLVMNLNRLNQIVIDKNVIIAQAGASLIDVSKKALEESLSGLEFACGIPGTIGGAVCMNAGAYGGEMKDCLTSIVVLSSEGDICVKRVEELGLAYRTSNIIEYNEIVLEATFQLNEKQKDEIQSVVDELTTKRRASQPLEYPSCGSVFKRPKNAFVGPMIIECGLQGTAIGGAQVSKKHAGFIVNINDATAKDYLDLIEMIRFHVLKKFNVILECEVKIFGDD